jgi:hypothetical protein
MNSTIVTSVGIRSVTEAAGLLLACGQAAEPAPSWSRTARVIYAPRRMPIARRCSAGVLSVQRWKARSKFVTFE